MIMKKRRGRALDPRAEQQIEKAGETAMGKAVKAELLAVLAGPLTPRALTELLRIAKAGREMLLARAPVGPRLVRDSDDGDTYDEDGTPVYNVGNNLSETYGATILRELLAAFGSLGTSKSEPEDVTSLVKALATARAEGLTDVENLLKARIAAATAPPVVPAALPPPQPKAKSNGKGLVA